MAAKGMLEPFNETLKIEGVISSGVGSYGYDMRVADEFKIYSGGKDSVLDPKNSSEGDFTYFRGDVCIIPPNSFALGRSVEYFRIPRDVLAICFGKSTYARCGIIVNVTPLEPEWEGFLTISIVNTAPVAAKVYSEEGIAQILFLKAEKPCETSYADRAGKYQAQNGITHSRT